MPLVANCVGCEVMWGGSPSSAGNATAVGAYAGVPVALSLRMQACELYSLRFAQ